MSFIAIAPRTISLFPVFTPVKNGSQMVGLSGGVGLAGLAY
jgi:hypothetical protein